MMHAEWFKNGLDVMSTEHGWMPVRFTDEQLRGYDVHEGIRIRSRCASGVMLDIVTDSDFIEIEYTAGEFARNWLYFDVYIDGIYISSNGQEPIEQKNGLFRCSLKSIPAYENAYRFNASGKIIDGTSSEHKRRVIIYLPHLVVLFIRQIRFSEWASIVPAPTVAGNLLCLGDSITQGMDARRPSSPYPVQLSRFLGMNLLNHGVGGHIFDASSLDPDLPYKPDLITVAYGTNDWMTHERLSELQQKCDEFLGKLSDLYPASQIVLLSPIWRQDADQAKPMGSFADMTRAIVEVAQGFPRISLIDGMSLVPPQPKFFGDGRIHPNEEGFLFMTQGILKHICSYK